jgi:transcriptional regulator with XRE-family HTH domain
VPTPGELIRAARARNGVTQQQLARRARTSQAAISRVERDLVSPSVTTLRGLLQLLGDELVLGSRPADFGHDRSLLRRNLAKTPEQRLRDGVAFSNFALRTRGVARGRR